VRPAVARRARRRALRSLLREEWQWRRTPSWVVDRDLARWFRRYFKPGTQVALIDASESLVPYSHIAVTALRDDDYVVLAEP
jgi:hypothetical protein